MKPYLISLAVGLGVGLLYSVLGVRSPAPPGIALLGLLGMLIGEHAGSLASRWCESAGRPIEARSAPVGKDHP